MSVGVMMAGREDVQLTIGYELEERLLYFVRAVGKET
jgi:hypothetical protein